MGIWFFFFPAEGGITGTSVSGVQTCALPSCSGLVAIDDVGVAGGLESMTRAPYSMPKASETFARTPPPLFDTTIGWRYPNPRMAERFDLLSLGETAENVAKKFGVSRHEQDEYALLSHQKAARAW